MLPETLECFRPFVKRPDGFGICAIKNPAALASRAHKAHVAQYAKMLRNRRLRQAQRENNVADGAFLDGEIAENVPAARFRDGVKSVRGGGGAWHKILQYIPI